MMKKPLESRPRQRSAIVVFNTNDDLSSGERLLRRRTRAAILRFDAAMNEHTDPASAVRVRDVGELETWLRSSRESVPATFLLALKQDFDLHQQMMASLASMEVRLPRLLSSCQDQIFVLDREQRMVAFFGHWPEYSPRRPETLLGKRKRDVFGSAAGAVHEDAGDRALRGEEVRYEWTVTDGPPWPVHLSTAASPLRNDRGDIVGIVLVTRDITRLKRAQEEIEATLKEKTAHLLEVEREVRQIADSFHRPSRQVEPATTPNGTGDLLSAREREVLAHLRRGVRLRSIAKTLGISVETVRHHVKAMFRKTGAHSQEELVMLFDTGEQFAGRSAQGSALD
jgi:PAS domain S-box-containing protein